MLTQRDFKSRVANCETRRDLQRGTVDPLATVVLVTFRCTSRGGERHASTLRYDFDSRIRACTVFTDRRPKRGLSAYAREHERTGFPANLFVLARIIERNFEHEWQLDA